MKHVIICLCLVAIFVSCDDSDKRTSTGKESLKKQIFELVKQEQLNNNFLAGIPEAKQKIILDEFNNPDRQINFVNTALNKGYLPLLEDIDNNKYECFGKEDLKKYQSSGWEIRNIGFPNTITRLKGSALLQKARKLQYEILIIKLLDNQELLPVVEEKELVLKQTIEELAGLAKEEIFVD